MRHRRRHLFRPASGLLAGAVWLLSGMIPLLPGGGGDLPGSGTAWAGGPLGVLSTADGRRVRSELERTDQVLVRAVDHLRDCTSIKGQGLLRDSRKIQDEAWGRFRRGAGTPQEELRNQAAALKLTLTARDLAVDAIETCQVEFKAQQALTSLLDSTQQLAAEARDAVRASGSADAERLLQAGIWQLEKAQDAYRSREFRKAITLGAAARRLVQRSLQKARMEAGPGGLERIQAAIDRTDQVLQDLERHVEAGDKKAVTLLERARQEQDQARTFLRDGRQSMAMRLTQAARRSALDALWEVQRKPDADRVAKAIEVVERVLEESAAEIYRTADPAAVKQLEAAEDQLEAAQKYLAEGKTAQAAQAVRMADSLLRRAAEGGGR